VSGLDHRLEPEGEVRRFEVITGAVGRRRWTSDDRARIIEETLVPGAVVSAVARRHGLTPQQLFTWRRDARRKAEEREPTFVPALVVTEPARVEAAAAKPARRRRVRRRGAAIEIEVAGVTVRVGDNAAPAAIEAVIRALKAVT
jgi:transposase